MRLLGGAALLSLLIVAGIVLFGGQQGAEHALGHRFDLGQAGAGKSKVAVGNKEGGVKSAGAHAGSGLNPIQSSRNIVDDQVIHTLFTGVRLDYLSAGESMSNGQVLASMHRAQLTRKISTRPRAGYYLYRRLSSTAIALCSQSTGNWHCYGTSLRVDHEANVYGATLKPTLKKLKTLLSRA